MAAPPLLRTSFPDGQTPSTRGARIMTPGRAARPRTARGARACRSRHARLRRVEAACARTHPLTSLALAFHPCARFIRESRLAASIEHPNIVSIYEADERDGALFIAMRYIDGPDLGTVIQR